MSKRSLTETITEVEIEEGHWYAITPADEGPSPRIAAAAVSGGLLALLLGCVLVRSWVFMVFPHAHFDSDQAVFGIMGKDIAAGRAYPLFMYGQRYMLAVGSWLCAPLFALFGASITTLKLPMLAMNLACVVMLWIGLRRERELGPWGTALAITPFAIGSVVVASQLIEHQGGNIEPMFFLLLAFLLREHAIALGLVFGIAVLNREFALIGLLALSIMDLLDRSLRAQLKQRVITIATMASTVALLRLIAASLPGYHGVRATGTLEHMLHADGAAGYLEQQLPVLLGIGSHELHDFDIASHLGSGQDWLRYLAALWVMAGLGAALRLRRDDLSGMSTYLVLIGAGQALAFVLLCGAPFDPTLVRYILVHLFFWVGLTACAWKWRALRPLLALCVLTIAGSNLRDHALLIGEYRAGPPRHENEQLARELLARGVHYGEADYRVAYDISWLTDEKIILSPRAGQVQRVQRYRDQLSLHEREAVRIADAPCGAGSSTGRWFICPLAVPAASLDPPEHVN